MGQNKLIDTITLELLEDRATMLLGTENTEQLMDALAAYASKDKSWAARHNHFALLQHGSDAVYKKAFVEYIGAHDIVFALYLFRAKPHVIGTALFGTYLPMIFDHIMTSGCMQSLDILWPLIPMNTQQELGAALPAVWWTHGHHTSAVTLAQGSKVPTTAALLFALEIAAEHQEWSRLIVDKHCTRAVEATT